MPGFLPKFAMTKQEYEAKALLLGFEYGSTAHLFYNNGAYAVYDPDTLEVLWSISRIDDIKNGPLVPEDFMSLVKDREAKYRHYLRR